MKAGIWQLIGYVKSSSYRVKVIRSLSKGIKTPNEIRSETKLSMPHTSRALRELKEMRLVECINPDSRKGKIYILTKTGLRLMKKLRET